MAVLFTVIFGASAANAIDVPGNVTAGQVERRLQQPKTNLSAPDFELPAAADSSELSEATKKKLEQSKFTLKQVEIEGSTVFTEDQLKFAYEDFIGKKISLLDAMNIAKQITNLYRSNGYILSQAVIPEQELNNGVLKVRIVEGFIGSYNIQGDAITEGQKSVIQSYADNILESRPVRTQKLERYLLLMNDLPGAKITGLLRPSASQFGAAELVLTVTDKAFEGAYSVNNRGSRTIGPWQHSVLGTANSLLGMYDQTSLRFSTTNPTTELRSYEFSHKQMLGEEGTSILGRFARTNTQPGENLKSLAIVGESNLFEAKLEHPFVRSRNQNLISRFAFEYNDTDTDVFKNVDFTEDRLRMLRLGTYFGFLDDWKGSNVLDLQLTQGLNIMNASEEGTNRSNTIGDSDFTKINFDASRLQNLFGQFSLLAAVSSQYSFDPLLVAEQFSLGGADFGRAYDPAELLGDSGIIGKLELRFDDVVGGQILQDYQLYTYYDLGEVRLRDVAPGVNQKFSLSSAGLGARANFTDNFSGNIELSFPLTKQVVAERTDGDDPRIFVGFLAQF